MRAIFDRARGGKAKRDKAVDEGTSDRPGRKNKKNKKKGGGSFMAATDRKAGKTPTGETPDYFEKLLEKPCTNHPYRLNHLLNECGLMKKWLSGTLKMGEQKKKPEAEAGDEGEKQDDFPKIDVILMIFGGPTACESKLKLKVPRREVFVTKPAIPAYLRWSESAITFDRADHPNNVP